MLWGHGGRAPQCPRESSSPVKSPLLLKLVAPHELSLLAGPEGLQATSCPRIGKNKQSSEGSGDPLISRCHSPRAQWLMLEEQRDGAEAGAAKRPWEDAFDSYATGMNEKSDVHLGARGGRKDSKSIGQTSGCAGTDHCTARSSGGGPQPSADVRLQGLTNGRDLPPPARAWQRGCPASPGGLCRRGQGMGLPGCRARLPSLPQL